jgi:hypothetical protein
MDLHSSVTQKDLTGNLSLKYFFDPENVWWKLNTNIKLLLIHGNCLTQK